MKVVLIAWQRKKLNVEHLNGERIEFDMGSAMADILMDCNGFLQKADAILSAN